MSCAFKMNDSIKYSLENGTFVSDDSGYITTPSPIYSDSHLSNGEHHFSLECTSLHTPVPENKRKVQEEVANDDGMCNLFLEDHKVLIRSTPVNIRTSNVQLSTDCSSICDSLKEFHVGCDGESVVQICKSNVSYSEFIGNSKVQRSTPTVFQNVINESRYVSIGDICHSTFLTPRLKNKCQSPSEQCTKKVKRDNRLHVTKSAIGEHTYDINHLKNFQGSKSQLFDLGNGTNSRNSSIGATYVDILYELGVHGSFELILSKIFSYLGPEDIVKVCLVSRTWYNICITDEKTNMRRLNYIDEVRHSKENLQRGSNKLEDQAKAHWRGALRQIQNTKNNSKKTSKSPPSPPTSPSKARFKMFIKVGDTLENGGRLVPCARCSRPSRIKPASKSALCSHESCQYFFCILCRCESHEGHPCKMLSSLQIKQRPNSIGSKESRKNLRRL